MTMTLTGKNVAILAANGFDENQMTEIQRALTKAAAVTKTISPEQKLVNGWQGDGWGHYFPVDAPIGEALGSDFDILVLPGGERSVEKLKTNPHARRIVTHFLEAGKPIAAIGAGVALLAVSNKISGRKLAAPEIAHDELETAGVIISADAQDIDGNILSSNGGDIAAWVAAALDFFSDAEPVMRAA